MDLSGHLQLCVQLGQELRRWRRYDPDSYDWRLIKLRDFYRELRDGLQLDSRWTLLRVEEALGQRGIGPKPLSQTPNCRCVPFPGAWRPNARTTTSEWHDRHIRVCLTCGEKRSIPLARAFWPTTRALWLDAHRSTIEGTSLRGPRKKTGATLHR